MNSKYITTHFGQTYIFLLLICLSKSIFSASEKKLLSKNLLDSGLLVKDQLDSGLYRFLQYISNEHQTDLDSKFSEGVKIGNDILTFVRAGADPNIVTSGCFSDCSDISPLIFAINQCDEVLVEILLEFKADPNIPAVLRSANICLNTRVLEQLFNAHMKIDTTFTLHDCCNRFSRNHMYFNHEYDDISVTKWLIKKGVQVNQIDKVGHSPLTRLCAFSKLWPPFRRDKKVADAFEPFIKETTLLLLSAGADLNYIVTTDIDSWQTRDIKGMDALAIAQKLNQQYLIDFLTKIKTCAQGTEREQEILATVMNLYNTDSERSALGKQQLEMLKKPEALSEEDKHSLSILLPGADMDDTTETSSSLS